MGDKREQTNFKAVNKLCQDAVALFTPKRKICLAQCLADDMPEWECDDAPLHEHLRRMGFEVETPDWRLTHDYDWSTYSLVVPRLVWNYQNYWEEFLGWMEKISTHSQLVNSIAVLKWSGHKSYLRDLEAAGVPVLPTVWIRKGEEHKLE